MYYKEKNNNSLEKTVSKSYFQSVQLEGTDEKLTISSINT